MSSVTIPFLDILKRRLFGENINITRTPEGQCYLNFDTVQVDVSRTSRKVSVSFMSGRIVQKRFNVDTNAGDCIILTGIAGGIPLDMGDRKIDQDL